MLQVVNNPMTNQTQTHADKNQHVLTVNVEDEFQVGVFRKFISMDKWTRFHSRLEANLNQVLDMLEQHQSTAIFFILGWTAERHPKLVRRITDAGHQVASRGHLHHRLDRLPRLRHYRKLGKHRRVLSKYLNKYSSCSVKDHAAPVGSPLVDLTVGDSSSASLIQRSTQRRVHSAQVSQLADENKLCRMFGVFLGMNWIPTIWRTKFAKQLPLWQRPLLARQIGNAESVRSFC